ncbi:DUF6531 domain-containing protein [Bdellovibrio bacteriovorus]|uniref:DUF6531 domain-containing protein n=1 Tax=Bdellovibrio bacteriovorus TaxID=959 RepID=UPI003A808126
MKKVAVFILALSVLSQAHALVDTSTGSFMHSWIDFDGKGLDLRVKLERTYNSRSTFKGWFGYGWCTDLETILINHEDAITIRHCGDGQEHEYKKMGSDYRSTTGGPGTIRKAGDVFQRVFTDGTIETFNSHGKLQEVKKNGDFVALKYNERGLPKELVDSSGRVVTIEATPTGFVQTITFKNKGAKAPTQVVGKYEYQGENLVSATNFWGNTYKYSYEKNNNMKKAIWPNGKEILLSYNSNDWVLALKGTDICAEDYSYKVDQSKKPPRYAVKVTKKCDNDVIVEKAYSYTYSMDNRRILAAELDEDAVRREFKYDEHGNVIEVKERRLNGDVLTKIVRNDRGLVVKISNVLENYFYKYRVGAGRSLVAEAIHENVAAGVVVDRYKFSMTYNDDDRMISVIKPNGSKLEFEYDYMSRVSKISTKDIAIEVVYNDTDSTPKHLKLGDKYLPLSIYDIRATPKEIAAVDLYFDYLRAYSLTIPAY